MIFSTRSGARIFLFCSAGKKPGQRALTRTFDGASSRATFWVRLITAAFEAEYAKTRESGRCAETLAILTIDAAPRLGHLLAEDLATPVNGVQIAGDDAVPVLVLRLEVSAGAVDARSIDDHIHLLLRLQDVREQVLDQRAAS